MDFFFSTLHPIILENKTENLNQFSLYSTTFQQHFNKFGRSITQLPPVAKRKYLVHNIWQVEHESCLPFIFPVWFIWVFLKWRILGQECQCSCNPQHSVELSQLDFVGNDHRENCAMWLWMCLDKHSNWGGNCSSSLRTCIYGKSFSKWKRSDMIKLF